MTYKTYTIYTTYKSHLHKKINSALPARKRALLL